VDELICGQCEFCEAGEPGSDEPTETAGSVSIPGMAARIWNAAHAIGAFVSDGFQLVPQEEYQKRLTACEVCEFRSGTVCSKCGCFIDLKARGRAFECPDNRW